MENLNSNNDTRCKVTFMNPLLKIDIFGYTHQQTMQLLNTIITVDNSRSENPTRPTFSTDFEIASAEESVDFKVEEEQRRSSEGTGYSTPEGRGGEGIGVLTDEGSPLPFSSVTRDRTPEEFTGEDSHGEGGNYVTSIDEDAKDNG